MMAEHSCPDRYYSGVPRQLGSQLALHQNVDMGTLREAATRFGTRLNRTGHSVDKWPIQGNLSGRTGCPF